MACFETRENSTVMGLKYTFPLIGLKYTFPLTIGFSNGRIFAVIFLKVNLRFMMQMSNY